MFFLEILFHSNRASLTLVKGGICESKGIDTGVIEESKWNIQLKYGAVYSLGGGDHTVGDEPLSVRLMPVDRALMLNILTDLNQSNFGGNPVFLGCTAVPLGALSEEGVKPLPGTTVPGKLPPPKPAAGNKDEDKSQTACGDKNSDGGTCPTSEVQTDQQVALSNDFSTSAPSSSDGSTASFQSAPQPDFLKPNDPNTPSLDSGQTSLLSANDNTASTQSDPLAAPSTYGTASLQQGPLADLFSSADSAAPLASSSALLTDPTSPFQPQDSPQFLASVDPDLMAGLA